MSDDLTAPIRPDERAEIDHALERWGGSVPVERVERLGGLTNRNYKLVTATGANVLRIPGRGSAAYIDRSTELHNARAAATLGVGPEILHAHDGVLVCEFIEGRTLKPRDFREDPATVARAGRLLRTVHDSGRAFVGRFDPLTAIADHCAVLELVPPGVDDLLTRVGRIDPPDRLVPCHGDPWPENLIAAGDRLHLLDWEYSGMGDPAWDLADLAVESGLAAGARSVLLTAYGHGVFDPDLSRRVDLLSPVTDLLWGVWALVQDRNGNTAEDFRTYGRRRLERARTLHN